MLTMSLRLNSITMIRPQGVHSPIQTILREELFSDSKLMRITQTLVAVVVLSISLFYTVLLEIII